MSNIGGYSLDGCCEFLPARAEGTTKFFKRAACDCHINFHCSVPATTLVMPINGDGHDCAGEGTLKEEDVGFNFL